MHFFSVPIFIYKEFFLFKIGDGIQIGLYDIISSFTRFLVAIVQAIIRQNSCNRPFDQIILFRQSTFKFTTLNIGVKFSFYNLLETIIIIFYNPCFVTNHVSI